MHALRILIGRHRHLAVVLLVLALCIKAAIPAGFMVASSADTVLTVTICSPGSVSPEAMRMVIPSKAGEGSKQSGKAADPGHCAFTGLSLAALGGADPFLLALAFAVILVLGLAAVRELPFKQFSHLRPPLRGPPAAA